MLAPVIAGVDGSAESLAAAAWAAREAERRGRGLRLLHVWNANARPGWEASPNAAQRYLARRTLRQAQDRLRETSPGTRPDGELVEGPVVTELLRAAGQADLLVLGSRGLSGFTGFLVGSVALGVVAKTTRPVVLVRAGEQAADEHLPSVDGGASTTTGYRDVVLGVDAGDPSDAAIDFAFEEARLRRARLRVVNAWQARVPLGRAQAQMALLDDARDTGEERDLLGTALGLWREKYPDVEVVENPVQGRASSVLVRAASGASLLVVGHRLAERPVGPRTGPVTHTVIHHVDCPVAVVPHD